MALVNHRSTIGLRELDLHRLCETLLEHGKLDGNVGQVSINFRVFRGP